MKLEGESGEISGGQEQVKSEGMTLILPVHGHHLSHLIPPLISSGSTSDPTCPKSPPLISPVSGRLGVVLVKGAPHPI